MNSPRDFDLPHDEWRPGQLETVKWINRTSGTLIVQAPTGSGKTGVGAALSKYGIVRSLTHTINLQQQYEKLYDFEPIYGMNNYDCAMLGHGATARECIFSEAMYQCPVKLSCNYLLRREVVKNSERQSLSYAYFLNSVWTHEHHADFLYCDEAHLLPQITRDYCTMEYTPQQLMHLDLPHYPMPMPRSHAARVLIAAKWLNKVSLTVKAEYNKLADIPPRKRGRKTVIKMRILFDNISRIDRSVAWATDSPQHFYASWDNEKFKLVPLTARLYFKNLFTSNWPHKAILTSATIGNPETLRRELGINYYKFRDVPSAFTPESMPVFSYENAPRLSHSLSSAGWREWAKVVADMIKSCDPSWSGLIHVSSANQAHSLANALARFGLEDRVYIPQGKGTGEKIEHWQARKKKVKNTLAISYSFHMGLDGHDDNINIIGKVPFGTLDEFGQAELDYDPDIYRHRAALLTEQAAGRIRRGQPEHYEEQGMPMRKFVAIADNNYIQLDSEFSSHFKKCIYPM